MLSLRAKMRLFVHKILILNNCWHFVTLAYCNTKYQNKITKTHTCKNLHEFMSIFDVVIHAKLGILSIFYQKCYKFKSKT